MGHQTTKKLKSGSNTSVKQPSETGPKSYCPKSKRLANTIRTVLSKRGGGHKKVHCLIKDCSCLNRRADMRQLMKQCQKGLKSLIVKDCALESFTLAATAKIVKKMNVSME